MYRTPAFFITIDLSPPEETAIKFLYLLKEQDLKFLLFVWATPWYPPQKNLTESPLQTVKVFPTTLRPGAAVMVGCKVHETCDVAGAANLMDW
jgi:hypothetical protein